ncbi:MAG: hypothetical protein ACE5EU_13305, partial [Paracoccaceae bacterium]
MRRALTAAIFSAGVLTGLSASAAAGAAVDAAVEALLKVCSNPETPAQDALKACRRVAEKGRLDARRRALAWLNAGIAAYSLGLY